MRCEDLGETLLKIETGRFIRSAVSESDFLSDGSPQIAFVGRSNVGKSSLLNRLLGRKSLARISSTPGRTRSINYFAINSRFHFVDLPGFGYAKVGKQVRRDWAQLMDRYFQTAPGRTLVVQLVDAKVGATDLDREAARYFAELAIPTTVVATKIDKVPRSRRVRNLQSIRGSLELPDSTPLIPFSSVQGEGVKELWREIEAFLDDRPSLQ
jgi:GTP-binding protein